MQVKMLFGKENSENFKSGVQIFPRPFGMLTFYYTLGALLQDAKQMGCSFNTTLHPPLSESTVTSGSFLLELR